MTITLAGGITFFGITFSPPPPPENTAAWYGGGTFGTGSSVTRITFATDTDTASVRGPLSQGRSRLAAAGNQTDGWFGGGYSPGNFSMVNRITYATDTATASVRGPLSEISQGLAAAGNTTNGWFGGGGAGTYTISTVSRITYATDTATASVRGPLSAIRDKLAAVGNTTDGWFGGGQNNNASNSRSTVNRITYATDTATASVRGPLSSARYGLAAAGNTTDGWFGGGRNFFSGPYAVVGSTVNRITYATDTATASVRGPLSSVRYGMGAAGNTTDGWFGSGYQSSVGAVSTVDRITYATDTATASVRGPLSSARYNLAAAGGIQ
jgi:hypothetical protein